MFEALVRRGFRVSLSVATICVLAAAPAYGVITDIGAGTSPAGPTGLPWYENVGEWQTSSGNTIASAIYIGYKTVVTVNHTWAADRKVRFGGTTYTQASAVRLKYNGTTASDIMLVTLTEDPGLPAIPQSRIISASPSTSETLYMVGWGWQKNPTDEIKWDVTKHGDNWTWVETTEGEGDYRGFKYSDGGHQKRWGTNTLEDVAHWMINGTYSLRTRFDDGVPGGNEAQASAGDSGGAVFLKNGGDWYLAGMMFAVTSWKQDGLPELHDQPGDTSILDYQRTHFADFSHSHYRSEIPEPGTVSLLGLAALALIGRRRRGSIR